MSVRNVPGFLYDSNTCSNERKGDMSKTDDMRAMREARFAARTAVPRRPPVATQSPICVAPASVEVPAPTPLPVAAPEASSAGGHGLTPGKPIHLYKAAELDSLVLWITRDGKPRTREDLVTTVMSELCFVRRGRKILAAVDEAIANTGVALSDESAA